MPRDLFADMDSEQPEGMVEDLFADMDTETQASEDFFADLETTQENNEQDFFNDLGRGDDDMNDDDRLEQPEEPTPDSEGEGGLLGFMNNVPENTGGQSDQSEDYSEWFDEAESILDTGSDSEEDLFDWLEADDAAAVTESGADWLDSLDVSDEADGDANDAAAVTESGADWLNDLAPEGAAEDAGTVEGEELDWLSEVTPEGFDEAEDAGDAVLEEGADWLNEVAVEAEDASEDFFGEIEAEAEAVGDDLSDIFGEMDVAEAEVEEAGKAVLEEGTDWLNEVAVEAEDASEDFFGEIEAEAEAVGDDLSDIFGEMDAAVDSGVEDAGDAVAAEGDWLDGMDLDGAVEDGAAVIEDGAAWLDEVAVEAQDAGDAVLEEGTDWLNEVAVEAEDASEDFFSEIEAEAEAVGDDLSDIFGEMDAAQAEVEEAVSEFEFDGEDAEMDDRQVEQDLDWMVDDEAYGDIEEEPVAEMTDTESWLDDVAPQTAEGDGGDEAPVPAEVPGWLADMDTDEGFAEGDAVEDDTPEWLQDAAPEEDSEFAATAGMTGLLSGIAASQGGEEEEPLPHEEHPPSMEDLEAEEDTFEDEDLPLETPETEWYDGDAVPMPEAAEDDFIEPAIDDDFEPEFVEEANDMPLVTPETEWQDHGEEVPASEEAFEFEPQAAEESDYDVDYVEDDFEGELAAASNAPDWLNAMVPGLDVDYEAEEDAPLEDYVEEDAYERQEGFDWLTDIVEEETQPFAEPPALPPIPEKSYTFTHKPIWMRDAAATVAAVASAVDGSDLPEWLDLDEGMVDEVNDELDDFNFDDNFDEAEDELDDFMGEVDAALDDNLDDLDDVLDDDYGMDADDTSLNFDDELDDFDFDDDFDEHD